MFLNVYFLFIKIIFILVFKSKYNYIIAFLSLSSSKPLHVSLVLSFKFIAFFFHQLALLHIHAQMLLSLLVYTLLLLFHSFLFCKLQSVIFLFIKFSMFAFFGYELTTWFPSDAYVIIM